MKKILNLSLGSSQRDFTAFFHISGESLQVKRVGFDGDAQSFISYAKHINEWDAVAVGGINSAYSFAGKSWLSSEYTYLTSHINKPVYDGLWVKSYYEPYSLKEIIKGNPDLTYEKWLIFSVLDRYYLYESLRTQGINTSIGDAYAALNIPIFFSHKSFQVLAACFMPFFARFSVKRFYPYQKEKAHSLKQLKNFKVILTETNFLFNKNPQELENKIIILSRAGEAEKEFFLSKGVQAVHALLPGDILSANLIEAMLGVAVGFEQTKENLIAAVNSIQRIS